MHAIVKPILTLVHNYRHDGREMTFYTTHLQPLHIPPSDSQPIWGLELHLIDVGMIDERVVIGGERASACEYKRPVHDKENNIYTHVKVSSMFECGTFHGF